jgi:hypothetical protein
MFEHIELQTPAHKVKEEEEPDYQTMVEQFMQEYKNQFDVFDFEEDGSFKPIFMVGKC